MRSAEGAAAAAALRAAAGHSAAGAAERAGDRGGDADAADRAGGHRRRRRRRSSAPPAPPKPAVRQGVSCPKRDAPTFPREAMRAKVEKGRVDAVLTIDEKGNVTDVRITSADPPRVFDRVVRDALVDWKCVADGDQVSGVGGDQFHAEGRVIRTDESFARGRHRASVCFGARTILSSGSKLDRPPWDGPAAASRQRQGRVRRAAAEPKAGSSQTHRSYYAKSEGPPRAFRARFDRAKVSCERRWRPRSLQRWSRAKLSPD